MLKLSITRSFRQIAVELPYIYSPLWPFCSNSGCGKNGPSVSVINTAHLHFLLCTTFSEKAEVHLTLNLADPKGQVLIKTVSPLQLSCCSLRSHITARCIWMDLPSSSTLAAWDQTEKTLFQKKKKHKPDEVWKKAIQNNENNKTL